MGKKYGDKKVYFPFTKGETQGITIEDGETEELRGRGALCLVGKLGPVKKFNKEAFKTLLSRIWRVEGRIFFKEIQETIWLFEFTEAKDKQRVLDGRPWSYDRSLLVINDFDGRTPPSQMDFSFSPIWIQIHDMPLGCMNRGIGFKIGSTIGKVEEVAVPADDVGWGRCLRVRVSVNLFHPLDRGRTIFLSGSSCWVSFRYEKLPSFCYRCGCILHEPNGCPERAVKQPTHTDGAPAWGSWLRADEFQRYVMAGEGSAGSTPPTADPDVDEETPSANGEMNMEGPEKNGKRPRMKREIPDVQEIGQDSSKLTKNEKVQERKDSRWVTSYNGKKAVTNGGVFKNVGQREKGASTVKGPKSINRKEIIVGSLSRGLDGPSTKNLEKNLGPPSPPALPNKNEPPKSAVQNWAEAPKAETNTKQKSALSLPKEVDVSKSVVNYEVMPPERCTKGMLMDGSTKAWKRVLRGEVPEQKVLASSMVLPEKRRFEEIQNEEGEISKPNKELRYDHDSTTLVYPVAGAVSKPRHSP